MLWRVIIAFCLLPTLAAADGGASPFAESSVSVILNKDGTQVDCSKPMSKANVRQATFKRQFTQISADQCVWSPKVNQTDPKAPAMFYRVGADVSCTLEETVSLAPISIAEDQFSKFLEQRGFGDVQLESTTTMEIDGKNFRLQQLRGRMPEKFDKTRPLFRIFMWIWTDSTKLVTFQCLGPAKAALQDKPQSVALTSTVRIDP